MNERRNYNKQPAWKRKNVKPRVPRVGPLEVVVIDNNVGQALKILEKKVAKDGILSELKRKRYAEKPSDKRRREKRESIKKARRAASKKNRPNNNWRRKKPEVNKDVG
jgi:small subunit ribosomal protein S21